MQDAGASLCFQKSTSAFGVRTVFLKKLINVLIMYFSTFQ